MKDNTTASKNATVFPGPWGGILGALLFFTTILLIPRESYALINYGTDLSYQQNDTVNGTDTTSSVQERFSFYFNVISKPSSRLSLAGILRFDVLDDKTIPGTNSLELQPNVDVNISSSAVQFGVGYRQIIQNQSVISGAGTTTSATNLKNNSDDWYVDTTIRAGKLPTFRLRYEVRDQSQITDGEATAKTKTDDLQGSLNYKLGPLFINANYRNLSTEDKITGILTDETQILGQASMSQKIGSKVNFGIRDDYNLDNVKTDNVTTTKRYSNYSELRVVYNPFMGLNLNSTYSYRMSDDTFAGTGKTTETGWYSSFNYAFPKYLRLYGSYYTLQTDNQGNSITTTNTSTTPATITTTITQAAKTVNDNAIAGLNFSNTFGKYAFTLRYERRVNTITTEQPGVTTITTPPPVTPPTPTSTTTTKNSVTTDNLDWVLSTHLKPYLLVTLSESYVGTATVVTPAVASSNGNTSNNMFRLKVDLGPVRNMSLNPYVDYTLATAIDGTQTVTKELVIPASFRIMLHQKLELNLSDNYQWSSSSTPLVLNTSSNNNALIRVTLLKPFPGTTIGGDASFTTSSTNTSPATSTSAYTLRVNWSKMPHTFAANLRYQTGTDTPATSSISLLYGLVVRLKKLSLAFQARYDYSVVMSSEKSSNQTIYMLLSMKK